MNIRFSPKRRYLVTMALVLVLMLVACSPFGARETPAAAAATSTVVSTQTPMPAIATPTSTQVSEPATPTPTTTFTPTPTEEPEPTLTPTVTPTEEAQEEKGEATAAPGDQQPPAEPESGNVVLNGSFEEGFDPYGVGLEWTAFATEDGAVYGWEDETDPAYISHGEHAQLMRIMGPSKPNQFMGLYQTVEVVPGKPYTLTLHGLIRSSLASEDYEPLAFRLQWALDDQAGTDWQQVEWKDWTDPGWNDVKLDAKNPAMNTYVVHVTPQANTVTLFIRGWSKWAFFQSEVKYYVDDISLEGPIPGEAQMPTTGGNTIWAPVLGIMLVLGFAIWEVRKRWAR
jgi:septal ring-binding cell division protein DamX